MGLKTPSGWWGGGGVPRPAQRRFRPPERGMARKRVMRRQEEWGNTAQRGRGGDPGGRGTVGRRCRAGSQRGVEHTKGPVGGDGSFSPWAASRLYKPRRRFPCGKRWVQGHRRGGRQWRGRTKNNGHPFPRHRCFPKGLVGCKAGGTGGPWGAEAGRVVGRLFPGPAYSWPLGTTAPPTIGGIGHQHWARGPLWGSDRGRGRAGDGGPVPSPEAGVSRGHFYPDRYWPPAECRLGPPAVSLFPRNGGWELLQGKVGAAGAAKLPRGARGNVYGGWNGGGPWGGGWVHLRPGLRLSAKAGPRGQLFNTPDAGDQKPLGAQGLFVGGDHPQQTWIR